MVLKVKKITTLSQRQPISKQFCQTFFKKQCVIKKNIKGLKNSSGRNNVGKTTVWHKGGGHKKKY
jgi:large subunit ribosomal protein L2